MKKLEDNLLWQEADGLAEYIYGKLEELPAEEEWDTKRKLRSSANDLIFYVAQGLGNASPSATEYDWGTARKCAFSLKTMYRFAGKQKFIEIEPDIMVKLDQLIKEINTEIDGAYKKTEAQEAKEINAWLKKYGLWKEMQDES